MNWTNVTAMVEKIWQSLIVVVSAEHLDAYPSIGTCIRMYERGSANITGTRDQIHPIALELVEGVISQILEKYAPLVAYLDYFIHNTRNPTVVTAIEALLTWILDLPIQLKERMYEEPFADMEALWGGKSQLYKACSDRLCVRYKLPIIPVKLANCCVEATYTVPFRSLFYPVIRGEWTASCISFSPLKIDLMKVLNGPDLELLMPSHHECQLLMRDEIEIDLRMVEKLVQVQCGHMKRLHDESFDCLVACGIGPRVAWDILDSCPDSYYLHASNLDLLEDFLNQIKDDTTFKSLMEKLGVDPGTNAYHVLWDQYETSTASTPSNFLSPICRFLQRTASQLAVVGSGVKQTDACGKPGQVTFLTTKQGTSIPQIQWDPSKILNEIELNNILATIDPTKVPKYDANVTMMYHGTSLTFARNIAASPPGIQVSASRDKSLDFGVKKSFYLGDNLQMTSNQTWKYQNVMRGIVVYAVPAISALPGLNFPGIDIGLIRKNWRQLVYDSRNGDAGSSLVQEADTNYWVYGPISDCEVPPHSVEEVTALHGKPNQLAVKDSPFVSELNRRILCLIIEPPITRDKNGKEITSNRAEPHNHTSFTFNDFIIKPKKKNKKVKIPAFDSNNTHI